MGEVKGGKKNQVKGWSASTGRVEPWGHAQGKKVKVEVLEKGKSGGGLKSSSGGRGRTE